MNDLQNIKILYVEDEPSIADLLVNGLGLFGINVHPLYTSAEDLLDDIHGSDFADAQLLLFDIRLPRMTGIQLATKLRENGETRPFMLVSAWPPPTQELLQELNAVFLPKPFVFPKVVETIKTLVQGQGAL